MTIQEIVEEIKTKTAVELCELVKARLYIHWKHQ